MKVRNFFSTNVLGALLVMALAAVVVTGCKKDDDPVPSDTVVASFQYEVSMDNFLEVTFSNFSQNATSYEWNFGDGNTSTDKDPTHVYATDGTYTVTLTAVGAEGKSATRTEDITLSDPDKLLTLLAGTDKKTWYLQREGIALGIGPAANDNAFWSFGGVTPLGARPCILDDSYTFHRDGTWEFESGNTIFIDSPGNGGWLDDDESCYDEDPSIWTATAGANIGADLSAFANGGNYTYEFNPNNQTITLLGAGAYIGLANKTETGDNYVPVSTKTYTIFNFVDGDVADSLQMAIVGNGFVWNFYLVSYENPADLPDIPTTLPVAGFGYTKDNTTVTFNNTSQYATSYMWDFGDGNTSTDENPVHTYAAVAQYTVTLTAMDALGNSDEFSDDIDLAADDSPSDPAPTPTFDPANVISVFSDAYTNLPDTDLNPNWSQATIVSEVEINGNNTLKYSGLNYQGIQLTPNQDVSGMTHLHLDYWTANSTTLNVFLISDSPVTETPYALTVPTAGWVSVDIPLSNFDPVDLTDVFQFKFDGNGDIFIDNIIFVNQ